MLVLLFHYYLGLYLLGMLWQFITSNIILTTQYEQKLKWSHKCLFFVCLAFIHIILVTQWFPIVIFTFMYRNPPPNSFKATVCNRALFCLPDTIYNLSWFFSHQDSLMSFKILSWFDSVFFPFNTHPLSSSVGKALCSFCYERQSFHVKTFPLSITWSFYKFTEV